MKWNSFLPLCVAVSLHIFIPFRILISFFTSCFVRYICFALCLVDKTHKIDLKKKISGVYSCPLSHRHEFLCDIALSRFQHALHSQRIISFRLSSSGVFLLEIGASSIREEISSIQNSKPIKKLRHFEWLHCLFSIHDRKHSQIRFNFYKWSNENEKKWSQIMQLK